MMDRHQLNDGDSQVLHGVSLELNPGKVLALFGANGAGKTTLFSVIAGNLRANDGSITFDGRRIQQIGKNEVDAARLARPGLSRRTA